MIFQSFFAMLRHQDRITQFLQQLGQMLADTAIVFDDEDRFAPSPQDLATRVFQQDGARLLGTGQI